MRQFRLLVGIVPALICLFALIVACETESTPTPMPTMTPVSQFEQAKAIPTLTYRGHFPDGYPTVVPIIYNMNDYANRDWATLFPEFGPMGAWVNFSWQRIHTGPGQFNWEPIDTYLAQAARYKVTLRDGTVISKPVAISIQVFPEPGYDNTPEWIYRRIPGSPTLNGRLVGQIVDPDGSGPCPPLAAPAWGNPIWQDYFDQMVEALGRKYNDDPRVNSVWITTGLYGETVIEKNLYPTCATYRFGTAADFGVWVEKKVLPKYREAFPDKPLYIINTGGGCLRRETSAIAAQFPVRIGIKHNSLTYDVRGEYDTLGCGKMETLNPYSVTNPIAFEHAFGATPWQVYWSTLNGLAHHADLFDFPYDPSSTWDILRVLAALDDLLHGYDHWEFIDRYLGRSLEDSPGVWIVFRDTQWPRDYGLLSGGQCIPYKRWDWGEEGRDWSFWLYRKDAWRGRAVALAQVPPNRDPNECDPTYPNIYSRYQELPKALRSDPTAEAKWWNDDLTIKEEIKAKIYGYYSCRRTDEPTNPFIYLDVDNQWAYWRNLPIAEPGGVAVYTVTVIYLDQGLDTWKLSYTDYYGQQRDKVVRKTNSQQWKAQVWRLSDMYLHDALTNTVDIVLNSNSDGNDYFHMVLIEAEGKAAPAPTPQPTVPPNLPNERVNDLEERTRSLQERLRYILGVFEKFGGF